MEVGVNPGDAVAEGEAAFVGVNVALTGSIVALIPVEVSAGVGVRGKNGGSIDAVWVARQAEAERTNPNSMIK